MINKIINLSDTGLSYSFSRFYNLVNTLSDISSTSTRYATIATDIDLKYLKPKYWKLDKFGNVTNTWCTIYIGDPKLAQTEADQLMGLSDFLGNQLLSKDNFILVNLYGVSIDISASPTVIETRVKGTKGPVYQTFGSSNYDITITFLESGPTFWQQNSKDILTLITILNSGETINIVNPELDIIYNVKNVICTGYSIGQDPRFYSHKNISIQFKSDNITQDILVPVKNTTNTNSSINGTKP